MNYAIYFTTIGSNVAILGQFAIVDKTTDNSDNLGHAIMKAFYLTSILW